MRVRWRKQRSKFKDYLGVRFDRGVTMGKTRRYVDLKPVLGRQLDFYMLGEGRGALAQIDIHIKNPSMRYPDEFGLSIGGRLVVEPANRKGVWRETVVFVHELRCYADALKIGAIVCRLNKTTLVRPSRAAEYPEFANVEFAAIQLLDDGALFVHQRAYLPCLKLAFITLIHERLATRVAPWPFKFDNPARLSVVAG